METLFVGKNAVFLPETESTNSYAITLLKNVNLAEGSIVHTAHQTQGRGQRGSSWMSEPASNLAVSVILKPGFLDVQKQFYLYQVAALACHDTIAQLLDRSQFDIKIKWPNDILVNDRKIAGVLIENNLTAGRLNWSVIGVGININQDDFKGLETATSVKQLLGHAVSVKDVLQLLCGHLEKHYLALKAGRLDAIKAAYRANFYAIETRRTFEIGGVQKTMLVKGVSPAGLLLLADSNGIEHELDVKEARWVF